MKDYYVFEWEGKRYLFEKYPEDKYKNIVFCCAKNEDEYIREWIEHYLNIGFDKIIIADNNDEEGRLAKVIEDHISRGNVQIFPINGIKGAFQTYIYSMMSSEGNYKWCAYFDCDEFLELSKRYKNIEELLNDDVIKDTDCLYVQWMIYGSNGQIYKKEGDVCKRFKFPVSPVCLFKENMYVKAIVNGKCKSNFYSPHEVGNVNYTVGGEKSTVINNVSFPLFYKKCFLKHYMTKSFEEYREKAEKGRCSNDNELLLKGLSRYFIMDDTSYNEKIYSDGIFWSGKQYYIEKAMSDYNMIAYMNITEPLRIYICVSYMLTQRKNKVIVVNQNLDNTIYNALLELAIRTDNILIAAADDDNILWDIFLKTNIENKGTYYIFRE